MLYWPMFLTAILILWTILVSPYSKYGDTWAIMPALVAAPLVLGLHILVAYRNKWRMDVIVYGLVHCILFFVIWLGCLMRISKDSI